MRVAQGMLGVATVLLVSLSLTAAKPLDDFVVNRKGGAAPPLAAEQAAAIVSAQLMQSASAYGIQRAADVLSVIGVPAGRLDLVEAGAGGRADEAEQQALAGRTWWIVRATGAFVPQHLPPGIEPRITDTGYYIVDGQTGEIWGMGTP